MLSKKLYSLTTTTTNATTIASLIQDLELVRYSNLLRSLDLSEGWLVLVNNNNNNVIM